MTAARHTSQVLQNTSHVLAIELYTAARALDLRMRQMPDKRMGTKTNAVFTLIRKKVPYRAGDAWWGPEIERVKGMILHSDFTSIVSMDEPAVEIKEP